MKSFFYIRHHFTSALIVLALNAWFCSLAHGQTAAMSTTTPRILVVGDSLSAEYGIARNTGWVELLNLALAKTSKPALVLNASISGDTTIGGLNRIDAALRQHQPSVVILELGANDALRGLPLSLTQKNIIEMIVRSQAMGAKVILIGMQIPPNYGRDYSEGFKNVFSVAASKTGAALVPFLFEGFADQRQYFQADGIHPNESAQPLMLATVRRVLDPLLN
jgi:acyl-CoA thioesterase-1